MLLLIAEISVKGQSDGIGTGQYQTCFLKWQIKSRKSKKNKHCVVTFFVDQITAGDTNPLCALGTT